MSVEILLMVNIAGITLLAYMIAINAHGPTRLGISYLLATIMLAGSVWVVVQHVNTGIDSKKVEEIRRLDSEKQLAEERLKSQEEALRKNRERLAITGKINAIITAGTALATTMQSVDLQDRNVDLDGLIARAVSKGKESRDMKDDFEKLKISDRHFDQSLAALKEAIQLVGEAAYYYKSFYYSEDTDQEQLRERIMRQKSRAAREKFQAAAAQLVD